MVRPLGLSSHTCCLAEPYTAGALTAGEMEGLGITAEQKLLLTEDLISARCQGGAASDCKIYLQLD